MTTQALREYLENAILKVVTEALGDVDSLEEKLKNQVKQAARREAENKAEAIVKYLNEFVHNKIDAIQGTVSNHESRLLELERRMSTTGTGTL